MPAVQFHHVETAYDKVGKYNQDTINGFSEEFLDRMIELVNPQTSENMLDAMAGNGNLTSRLYNYCKKCDIDFPNVYLLDTSHIQCEFARERLAAFNANVIWGDILTMKSYEDNECLPENFFDTVMIKSGNHEIPLEKQAHLYTNLFRILKPGGIFVNLGLLFDDMEERNQFQELTRFKDRMAGLDSAVTNRHVLTREELYSRLRQVGFVDIRCGMHFHYSFHSWVVVRAYFPQNVWDHVHSELQAQQAKATILRRNGRIHFERDCSIMLSPGEITVAHRPLSP